MKKFLASALVIVSIVSLLAVTAQSSASAKTVKRSGRTITMRVIDR